MSAIDSENLSKTITCKLVKFLLNDPHQNI